MLFVLDEDVFEEVVAVIDLLVVIGAGDDDIAALEDCDGDFLADIPFGRGAFLSAIADACIGICFVPVVHYFDARVDAWFEACEDFVLF